jgi:hypothetical protein
MNLGRRIHDIMTSWLCSSDLCTQISLGSVRCLAIHNRGYRFPEVLERELRSSKSERRAYAKFASVTRYSKAKDPIKTRFGPVQAADAGDASSRPAKVPPSIHSSAASAFWSSVRRTCTVLDRRSIVHHGSHDSDCVGPNTSPALQRP